jgi:hypothetical protein
VDFAAGFGGGFGFALGFFTFADARFFATIFPPLSQKLLRIRQRNSQVRQSISPRSSDNKLALTRRYNPLSVELLLWGSHVNGPKPSFNSRDELRVPPI